MSRFNTNQNQTPSGRGGSSSLPISIGDRNRGGEITANSRQQIDEFLRTRDWTEGGMFRLVDVYEPGMNGRRRFLRLEASTPREGEEHLRYYDDYYNQSGFVITTLPNMIPRYPTMVERGITDEIEEIEKVQTLQQRSKVYRYSASRLAASGNVNGWIDIQPIHLYGSTKFHNKCDDDYCVFCIELQDRFYNACSGHFDLIPCQITGDFDIMPLGCNPYEWIDCSRINYAEGMPIGYYNRGHYLLRGGTAYRTNIPRVPPRESARERRERQRQVPEFWEDIILPDVQVVGENMEITTTGEEEQDPDAAHPTRIETEYLSEDEVLCAVCQGDLRSDNEVYDTPCLHKFHIECLQSWINTHNHFRCPVCRSHLNLDVGESFSFDFNVEYATSDTAAQMEMNFDDPIPYTEFVMREAKYHVLILTGKLLQGQKLVLKSDIVHVKDLKQDELLLCANKETYVWEFPGDFELELVCTTELEAGILSNEPVNLPHTVVNNHRSKRLRIGIVGFGTGGDCYPLLLIKKHLESLQYEVIDSFPEQHSSKYPYNFQSFFDRYYNGMGIGGTATQTLDMMVFLETWVDMIKKEKPDMLIFNPMAVCLAAVCNDYGITSVCVGSCPRGVGAVTFVDHSTKLGSAYAKIQEQAIELSIRTLLSTKYGFSPRIEPTADLLLVAPEIIPSGIGNLILNDYEVKEDIDVFVTLSSIKDKAVEDYFFNVLNGTKLRVVMQTSFDREDTINVTFVKKCNHEAIMRHAKVVICHGGSGTVQTALRNKCAVLVKPLMVDQKYWPFICKDKFPIEICKDNLWDLMAQIKRMLHKRPQGEVTGISVSQLVDTILSKYKKPELEDGTYVYSQVENYSLLCALDKKITGKEHLTHMGLVNKKGPVYTYIDMITQDKQCCVRVCMSLGLIPRTTVAKVNADMRFHRFRKIARDVYNNGGLFGNCRTVVGRYLQSYGIKIDDVLSQLETPSLVLTQPVEVIRMYDLVNDRWTHTDLPYNLQISKSNIAKWCSATEVYQISEETIAKLVSLPVEALSVLGIVDYDVSVEQRLTDLENYKNYANMFKLVLKSFVPLSGLNFEHKYGDLAALANEKKESAVCDECKERNQCIKLKCGHHRCDRCIYKFMCCGESRLKCIFPDIFDTTQFICVVDKLMIYGSDACANVLIMSRGKSYLYTRNSLGGQGLTNSDFG